MLASHSPDGVRGGGVALGLCSGPEDGVLIYLFVCWFFIFFIGDGGGGLDSL